MIRQSAFYFVVAIFLSCTEKETTKDKYPNIPYFPDSSSKRYVFKKTSLQGSERLENFIVLESVDHEPGNFTLFDLRSATLREIRLPGTLSYVDKLEGSFISRMNDSTFVRYKAPTFAPETVPFKKDYRVPVDAAKKTRPLLNFPSLRARLDSTAERFPCVTLISEGQYSLIRAREGSIIVDSHGLNGELDDCDHVLAPLFPTNFLKPFDDVVLGYSFSGSNHIAFGIEANKLNYYRIVIGQDTLNFKDHSDYFQLYQVPGQNPVVIDGSNNLYEVKLK